MDHQPLSPFSAWTSPEEAGVSSAGLLGFLDAWEQCRDVVQFHSMILLRHGKTVFRINFAPYDDVTPHSLYSLSKSFTSAAAGFAVHEGKLNWNSSVVDILPEEIPEGREEELRAVTVETLLSMGSGLDPASDSPSPSPEITWARHVLSHQLVHPPMTHFHYNTFGTYLVSCMVQKVTGQNIRDYLVPRLFGPLGIGVPEWDMSPEGVCCGGFGLHLSAEAIARFGQCLLQKGVWQGSQLLPEGWVDLATRFHIANDNGQPQPENEWAQGYGFQFWRCLDGRYRGDGAMGQACFVDEKHDAVLAVTCGTTDMRLEFRLIREHLFNAFDAPAGSPAEQEAFAARAKELGYAFVTDDGSERPLPEGNYELPIENGVCRLAIRPAPLGHLGFELSNGPAEHFTFWVPRGHAGLCGVLPCIPAFQRSRLIRYFGCYGWQDGGLHVVLRSPDGPNTLDGVLTWTDGALCFDGLGIAFPNGHVELRKATEG